MSNNIIQNAFTAGELSPALYARTDLGKYHVGAALVENFVVDFKGGVFNRAGTEFIQQCLFSDGAVRIIEFQFSTIQTYILEFGHTYIRFYAQGAPVLEAAEYIADIIIGSEVVLAFASPHGYINGDWIVIKNIDGFDPLNGRTVIVTDKTSTTFKIKGFDGAYIGSAIPHTGGGTVARVYTLNSPYNEWDLALLKYVQSADVMTITHADYPIYNLNRISNANWTITTPTIGTTAVAPLNLVVAASAAGAAGFAYRVTTVNFAGEESLPSAPGFIGTAVDIRATAGSIEVAWDAAVDADYYRVYKCSSTTNTAVVSLDPWSAMYGWMTDVTSNGLSASDDNITPDFTSTPPKAQNPFATQGNPGVVAYFQQRRIYAASNGHPETLWMSQPGNFNNFDISVPVKDDDAISVTLASKQVNNIKYMVGMPGGLIVLTGSTAWQISGGQGNSAVTPASLVATTQAYTGCADLPPIVINYDILFVQARGNVVRDFSYNFYVNIYTGIDISLLSNHLLVGYQLKEWTYCEEPYKVVWIVRSDGELLSLTYLKEQEVYGWAHHHTAGRFKSVASIQEGTENVVYFVVQRYIRGRLVQYIERMHTRQMPYGVEDAWYLDCALRTNFTYPAATLNAGSDDDEGGNYTLFTASLAIFSIDHIGCIIRMGGGIAEIREYVSPTQVLAHVTKDITDTLYGDNSVYNEEDRIEVVMPQAAGTWSIARPITTVLGLDHLEGQTVGVFVDGSVQNDKVVYNGAITLDSPGTKVVVGLRYASRLQTLRLETGEPTTQGKRKKISALTVRVQDTRGLKMGSTWETLTEYKMRDTQPMGTPIGLTTGDQRIIMDPSWTVEGQICIRQDYPLPATVLGVIPEVVVGDTGSK